ncbi:aldehyde dehydrogenase family protein [Rhodococcus sp. NBC_00297]|uniref:aldehyde dehydrogenase family protein n=1 Tax=Rhodococcus sp. NBC_00297 TaxID=2976005 RepID=UPI002E29283A|nr:aldehyde dehydrogenase family protein [Rhodococcus sp. NBC_00297]
MSSVASPLVIGGVEIPTVRPQLFIAGQWRDASDGSTFEVLAPASEEHLAHVAAATEADVDAAVSAARAQFDGGEWSRLAPFERGLLLFRLADLIERDAKLLATLEAADVGRPIFEPTYDMTVVVDVFRHFGGWADKIDGRWLSPQPAFGHDRRAYTVREALGVVGAITPWNLPTLIAAWKLAPALAAGNTVVLKPAEDATLSILHLARLIEEAGFPPGSVNVVPGLGKVAGSAIVKHAGVDKVSFTGSTAVGREISLQAAGDFKRVTLELGGKSPQLVFADSNVDEIVPGIAAGFFANQGQTCAAGSRILVAREKYDDVVAGLAAVARSIRLGDPFDPETQMGALVNARQRERVLDFVARGQADGAELVAGGGRPDRAGFFVEPTIFAGGGSKTSIAQEEIFGPVGLVLPFDSVDEAVAMANDTRYGLAAYVWTRDISLAHQVAARVKAGAVYINGGGAPDARLPWGGTKASGVGRELGFAGIEANTEEKSVTLTL